MAFKKPKVHYNWEASLVDAALISCAAPKISPSRGPPLSSCRPRATPPLLQAAGLLCAPFPSLATCTQVHPVPWVTEAVHRALTFSSQSTSPWGQALAGCLLCTSQGAQHMGGTPLALVHFIRPHSFWLALRRPWKFSGREVLFCQMNALRRPLHSA